MSDFLKLLNGQYGMYYRKMEGGKGYVFQGRFKSTLIENDSYLLQSIRYLLQNPVRAGIVQHAYSYIWSSALYYFSNQKMEIVDAEYVNQLFGNRKQLFEGFDSEGNSVLPVIRTKHGEVLGSDIFMEMARKRHNRRKSPTEQSLGIQRLDDRFFEPIEKVFREFKNIHGVDADNIDTRTWEGKRLRGELLVLLKERAGLKYIEIGEFNAFSDLSFTSLAGLYRRSKKTRSESE